MVEFQEQHIGRVEHIGYATHDTWVGLGKTPEYRKRAYLKMFGAALDQHELDAIRRGIAKGLPTGSDVFRANIEQALSVTLGSGKQGRPRKDLT